jgi:hypothetical protein
MIEKEKQLWKKISKFELDYEEANFNFSQRLARENNWTISYAKRVIEEYKKYIFLCCTTHHGATPSDQVDQAWHLHLTYTKSYWIDFCKNTLNKEIHHNPTKGGPTEAEKFDDYYTKTQEAYKVVFNVNPPEDIWPNNQERFSDIDFKRVNMTKHWVIKKPRLNVKKVTLQVGIPIACLSLIQASDKSGNDILTTIFVIGFAFIMIRSILKRNGNNNSGCSSGGCGSACSSGHSGCSSGDSGCSSGCGGCGGD